MFSVEYTPLEAAGYLQALSEGFARFSVIGDFVGVAAKQPFVVDVVGGLMSNSSRFGATEIALLITDTRIVVVDNLKYEQSAAEEKVNWINSKLAEQKRFTSRRSGVGGLGTKLMLHEMEKRNGTIVFSAVQGRIVVELNWEVI